MTLMVCDVPETPFWQLGYMDCGVAASLCHRSPYRQVLWLSE